MKLVYIANIRLPTEKAHGIHIMKMCEAFSKRGLSVELLVPRRINDLLEDPFDFYQVKRNFKITRIPCLDLVSFDFFRIGFLISTLSFLALAKIYLFFHSYNILHSREPLTSLFFKNYLLELHNWPRNSKLSLFLLSRPKKILALTEFLKNDLKKLGLADDKIIVVPDAVDLAEFDLAVSKEEARKKLNLPFNKTIILYTGSFLFYGWKGVGSFIEATKFSSHDFLFVLVGGHPWEMKKIRELPLSENILLLPYQKHRIIPYYLKSADILIIPNEKGDAISEKYTSPLKLFEYMASGRPIVASDLPSLREILTEKDAIFFKPADAQDLAKVISRLAADQGLQKQLSRNAYLKVSQYTWDKRADKIIKILNLN